MDISPWLTSVTGLANLMKAWYDAKTSGLKVEELREQRRSHTEDVAEPQQEPVDVVISPALQKAYEEDIEQAMRRFEGVINDPRYTPADIDQECERARLAVCTHLARIREFNDGKLPTPALARYELSYGCRTAPSGITKG